MAETSEAQALADDLIGEIARRAMESIDMATEVHGEHMTADQREAAEVGVHAGLTTTMLILRERGILP